MANFEAIFAESNARWQVAESLADSEPIPHHLTGGIWTEYPVRPPVLTEQDFRGVLARPTANPFLLQRRVDHGIIDGHSIHPQLVAHVIPGGSDTGPLTQPLPSPPASVDWRQRFGWPWITSVQNQGCQDCWCFAAVALVDAMVRIEHCVWFKGSEDEVRWGYNYGNQEFTPTPCAEGGGPNGALQYAIDFENWDSLCEPYTTSNAPTPPCRDSDGRSVRLVQAGYTMVPQLSTPNSPTSNVNYQMEKVWLDLNGPFVFFIDASLLGAIGSGVYDWQGTAEQPLSLRPFCSRRWV